MKSSVFYIIFYIISLHAMISCSNEKPRVKPILNQEKKAFDTIKQKQLPVNKTASKTVPIKKVSGATAKQLEKAKKIIASVSEKEIASVDANKKYKMFCASCHGIKGNMGVNGAKDLTLSTISLEESVAQVYHGKGLMTPFKGVLKEREIVAISKYLEKLRN